MATQYTTMNPRVIHVRFEGRSFDVPVTNLDISERSTDHQVRQSLARQLEVDLVRFEDYVIDWHANGNMTLRPIAVFG